MIKLYEKFKIVQQKQQDCCQRAIESLFKAIGWENVSKDFPKKLATKSLTVFEENLLLQKHNFFIQIELSDWHGLNADRRGRNRVEKYLTDRIDLTVDEEAVTPIFVSISIANGASHRIILLLDSMLSDFHFVIDTRRKYLSKVSTEDFLNLYTINSIGVLAETETRKLVSLGKMAFDPNIDFDSVA